ncbi:MULTISPECIES: helicase-exonuclease AddAB subunit AddA [Pontibacillus]|uniref:ATP-dependent helicase/nuclease subunit A n=1 Tax=Pontibacillus chungwhensis TaxID=265426 RepID=A0ABY8UZP7_9BACI|nr:MULTISPECIES: helicase-exonuclease AddAB subunit AddA [Pontibacillus]MCD5325006.1 helicase-exonuclease AddAB subunit AddA [Pontibacillus sp. HN14]WIF98959.1 helicase-exonuclease AddAB subunit AddA [Pontibacillus chungwhensis]
MPSWTPEQEQAIYTSGKDVLVSAAAGSGKTAVLVERIIQKLLNQDNPTDIDTLLVVTFTNAAAQEMRNRVGEALEKALEENPGSMHLKKQLSLLQRASISTLHSFCLDVVRRYAYQLDLDPQFRIADEIEGDLIRQEILEDLFEEWYGKDGEEREAFFEVVNRFSGDRSDQEVESLMLSVYNFAMQNPWPETWMEKVSGMYHVTKDTPEEEIEWLTILKREVKSQLHAMLADSEQALNLTREPDGPYHYAEAIDDDREKIQQALGLVDISWHELQQFMENAGGFKALSRKKVECSDELKDQVKTLRDRYKKRFTSLKEDWFARSLPAHLGDMKTLAPVVDQLMVLVKEFHERFQKKKKEQALVDFADLEHYCLQVLMDENSTPGDISPSEVAKGYQAQFTELLVDEYQDTNLVQETILRMVTDGEHAGNLFMVGDVKQSIYRFRHAEPTLFLQKYKEFAGEDHPSERIDLARNFRSRKEVLHGTNYIFRQLLDEEVGEMTYDKDAELIYSNTIYDELTSADADAELLVIDRQAPEDPTAIETGEEGFQDLEKAQIEARAYAQKIRQWLGHGDEEALQVVDKETGMKRSIQFRDIVILMRSMTWAPTIVEELKQQGIPVYAELSSGYFEAIEIKIMISLLKVIDNPRQDIPLASVLRSPIVGLNEDELTNVRLAKRKASYYEALQAYKRVGDDDRLAGKVEHFLMRLETWRVRARQGSLSELIWQVYRETGYYDFVGGIPGGRQRQANLRALYDRSRSYEATSFRGLFRFLRFIERIEERGEDLGAAKALGEQEDVVRIMTIHKSKGLEFPAVLLGGMDKQFNQQDLMSKYLLHKDHGFGSKFIDPNKRIMYPTLAYHALKKEKQRELLAEEMRVLYVALTRAKEKLVMVGNVASLEKKLLKWREWVEHPHWVLPAHYRLESKSYLDWVAPALIRHQQNEELRGTGSIMRVPESIVHDESTWRISLLHSSAYQNPNRVEEKQSEALEQAIREWKQVGETHEEEDEVSRRLSFMYPHQNAIHHRAKQSVTELKRQREVPDEYSADSLIREFKQPIVKRPRFMQENRSLTAAEAGSAMHTVMQHLPFTRKLSAAEIEEYVELYVEKEHLTREEADAINIQAIEAFFESEMGEMVIESSEVHREVPFTLTIPAHEVYADWKEETDETVFVQGVIDCILPGEGGWIILDYKTDKIQEGQTEESLKERYSTQLSLYAEALSRIWKKPITAQYLYFFDATLLTRVDER